MAKPLQPHKFNIGDKLGKLTIIGFDEDYVKPKGNSHIHKYICKCDCGNTVSVREDMLLYGHGPNKGPTRSCGCIRINMFVDRNTKHGLGTTRLYKEYHSMMRRCNKPNSTQTRYKEAGIYVCDEWADQENYKGLINFYNWSMGNGYSDNLTLDRIDNDGPYAPWNCRWVPMTTQANNKSNNKFITFNGNTYTYAQWCRVLNLPAGTVCNEMLAHRPIEEIFYGTSDCPRLIPAIYFVDDYGNPIGIDDTKLGG